MSVNMLGITPYNAHHKVVTLPFFLGNTTRAYECRSLRSRGTEI